MSSLTLGIVGLRRAWAVFGLDDSAPGPVTATLTKTLGASTVVSASRLAAAASLAKTLGACAQASASRLAVAGSVSKTCSASVASGGRVAVSCSAPMTCNAATSASVSGLAIRSTLSAAVSTTAASAARVLASASLARATDSAACSSAGATGPAPVSGYVSHALAQASALAAASVRLSGTASALLPGAALASMSCLRDPVWSTSMLVAVQDGMSVRVPAYTYLASEVADTPAISCRVRGGVTMTARLADAWSAHVTL